MHSIINDKFFNNATYQICNGIISSSFGSEYDFMYISWAPFTYVSSLGY